MDVCGSEAAGQGYHQALGGSERRPGVVATHTHVRCRAGRGGAASAARRNNEPGRRTTEGLPRLDEAGAQPAQHGAQLAGALRRIGLQAAGREVSQDLGDESSKAGGHPQRAGCELGGAAGQRGRQTVGIVSDSHLRQQGGQLGGQGGKLHGVHPARRRTEQNRKGRDRAGRGRSDGPRGGRPPRCLLAPRHPHQVRCPVSVKNHSSGEGEGGAAAGVSISCCFASVVAAAAAARPLREAATGSKPSILSQAAIHIAGQPRERLQVRKALRAGFRYLLDCWLALWRCCLIDRTCDARVDWLSGCLPRPIEGQARGARHCALAAISRVLIRKIVVPSPPDTRSLVVAERTAAAAIRAAVTTTPWRCPCRALQGNASLTPCAPSVHLTGLVPSPLKRSAVVVVPACSTSTRRAHDGAADSKPTHLQDHSLQIIP